MRRSACRRCRYGTARSTTMIRILAYRTSSGGRSRSRSWTERGWRRTAMTPRCGGWRYGTPRTTCIWWRPWCGRTAERSAGGMTIRGCRRPPGASSGALGCTRWRRRGGRLRRTQDRRSTPRPRRAHRRDPPQGQTRQGPTGRGTPTNVPTNGEVANRDRRAGSAPSNADTAGTAHASTAPKEPGSGPDTGSWPTTSSRSAPSAPDRDSKERTAATNSTVQCRSSAAVSVFQVEVVS